MSFCLRLRKQICCFSELTTQLSQSYETNFVVNSEKQSKFVFSQVNLIRHHKKYVKLNETKHGCLTNNQLYNSEFDRNHKKKSLKQAESIETAGVALNSKLLQRKGEAHAWS